MAYRRVRHFRRIWKVRGVGQCKSDKANANSSPFRLPTSASPLCHWITPVDMRILFKPFGLLHCSDDCTVPLFSLSARLCLQHMNWSDLHKSTQLHDATLALNVTTAIREFVFLVVFRYQKTRFSVFLEMQKNVTSDVFRVVVRIFSNSSPDYTLYWLAAAKLGRLVLG